MIRLIAPLLAFSLLGSEEPTVIADGSSPQIAVDTRGTIRLVFGRRDSIFVVTSSDNARSFGAPTFVGAVPNMHLGNTRGPTIASSATRSAIMAIDNKGTISIFELDHRADRWTRRREPLNSAEGSAPEGLGTIAADDADNFYTTWLDLREGRQNQIYFAKLGKAGAKTVDRRIYASPAGHVCECCRPTVAISGRNVAVMFRNWIDGARDLYVIQSTNAGATFSQAAKLGQGTWKLDACPMDGGDMTVSTTGDVVTAWRRELDIFVARPGQTEARVASGRSPMLATNGKKTALVWQDGRDIRLRSLDSDRVTVVGQGRLPQVAILRDGNTLVAWEADGKVILRSIQME